MGTSSKNTGKNVSERKNDLLEWLYLLPLIIAVSIVPLIVYLKVIPLEGIVLESWTGHSTNYDFFSYWKGVWLRVTTAIGFLTFIILYFIRSSIDSMRPKRFKKKKVRLHPLLQEGFPWTLFNKRTALFYVPLGVYALFIILSTVFAQHRGVALSGFPDRYEGMWVLLSYVVLCFLAINMVQNERQLKKVLLSILISALLAGTIGIFQYIGQDLLQTEFVSTLMIPSTYHDFIEQISSRFGRGLIYITMYNINYVGSYMAMVFLLSFSIFLLVDKKQLKTHLILKFFLGLFSILMLANLIGSQSRTGIFATFVATLVLLITLHRVLLRRAIYIIAILLGCTLLYFGLNHFSSGRTAIQVSRLISELESILQWTERSTIDRDHYIDIKMEDPYAATVYPPQEGPPLTVRLHNSFVYFQNQEGEIIEYEFDEERERIFLQDETYSDFYTRLDFADNTLTLMIDRFRPRIYFQEDGIYFLNNKSIPVPLEPVESWGFTGLYSFGSHRGYIWSRTIPILKETFFLGHGPDTFIIHFPQNDILGRLNIFRSNVMVDKPHNMYLQTGVNTGVISLLAKLALFGIYFVSSLKLYFGRKDFSSLYASLGVGLFGACLAYAVAGLANDSIVSVAPVFWVLLGLGIHCNLNLMNQREEKRELERKET